MERFCLLSCQGVLRRAPQKRMDSKRILAFAAFLPGMDAPCGGRQTVSMFAEDIYLSVVAAVRNDDHGGNLLHRLQTFVDGLIGQAGRHGLAIELVLVEWNPPSDRTPLAEVVRWPVAGQPARVRILTVPAELHRRYRFSEALPLYQMIAKNVGIRRAAGEFVLATNIDILFSDELMAFLASRRLDPGRMYRMDRTDVESDVPAASIDEQLAYCRSHRLRLNAREGTFALTPEGFRRPAGIDIVDRATEIYFGAGWYAPEQIFGQVFRWVADVAEIEFRPIQHPRVLALELEPRMPCELEINGACVPLQRRSIVRCLLPAGSKSLSLQFLGDESPGLPDGRSSRGRALACTWASSLVPSETPAVALSPAGARFGQRIARTFLAGSSLFAGRRRGQAPQRVGIPVPLRLVDRLQPRREAGGISIAVAGESASRKTLPHAPADLHTNACGDFTLLHRDHWFNLRGYPEFDLYSMNLDALFCYMAHYSGVSEEILREPMRIYHIEHATGSGWTPEGHRLLFERLASKGIPWLDFGQVLGWAAQMERLHTTMIFNQENWGLAECNLPERSPGQV